MIREPDRSSLQTSCTFLIQHLSSKCTGGYREKKKISDISFSPLINQWHDELESIFNASHHLDGSRKSFSGS